MTITTQYAPITFTVSGPGPYNFPFDIIEPSDLYVTIDDTVVAQSQYAVLLAGDAPIFSGGSITLLSPPATGEMVIYRVTNETQEVVYQPYTPFPAAVTEFALDKLTMLAQEDGPIAGGGGSGPNLPTDPVFNTVTVRQPNPVYILDNMIGGLARLGASAGPGLPGISVSNDNGATWINVLTTTGEDDDPTAVGEVQIYGPGPLLGGPNDAYLEMVVAQEVLARRPINMNLNRIYNLNSPTTSDEVCTKGYADSIVGSGGTDPVFNTVTIQQATPALILDALAGDLASFGASQGPGNPGIQYSPDSGVTWLPMFTFTDNSVPAALGETQIYGPDGLGGVEGYFVTLAAGFGQMLKDLDMNTNRITGLVTPIAANEAASKGYVDLVAGGGSPDPDPVFNTVTIQQPFPVLILDDGSGALTRFGADSGGGNPGFSYSPDNGFTWVNVFGWSDLTDPAALGETQIYGPNGLGNTTPYLATEVAGVVGVYRDFDMKNAQTMTNLPDAVAGNDATPLSQVSALISASQAAQEHGDLQGLADDDHQQYYNQARGDARYIQSGQLALAGAAVAGGKIISDGVGSQSIATTWGITAATIFSGDRFRITLAVAIPNINNIVCVATAASITWTTVNVVAQNSTTIDIIVGSFSAGTFTPIVANGLNVNFTVHNAGLS